MHYKHFAREPVYTRVYGVSVYMYTAWLTDSRGSTVLCYVERITVASQLRKAEPLKSSAGQDGE